MLLSAASLLSAQSAATDALGQARRLLDAGELAQAESAARGYLADHETSAEGRYLLAFILFREDKPAPSLAEYTRAAHLQRPTEQQLQYVALDYVLANDYPDADKWMTQATEWAPQDGEAWYSLGRIKYTENRFQEALSCFNKALALMPRSVKAENNMGLTYEGLDRNADALAAYRQAVAWLEADGSAKPDAQPYVNLGTLLLEMNQVQTAAAALSRAEALAPNDAKLHMTVGKLDQREGKLPDAEREFARAVALSPQTAAYHFMLGQTYRKSGEMEKAKAEFATAARLDGAHSSP